LRGFWLARFLTQCLITIFNAGFRFVEGTTINFVFLIFYNRISTTQFVSKKTRGTLRRPARRDGGAIHQAQPHRTKMSAVMLAERFMRDPPKLAILRCYPSSRTGSTGVFTVSLRVAPRLAPFRPHVEKILEGRVQLPFGAPFRSDFAQECIEFPHGRHTDQVDAFSQAMAGPV
jgi:hypothetical protein